MKNKFIHIIFMVTSLFAGKYVAEFSEIGISARSSGMGTAFTSLYSGSQSQFYNPAGIAGSRGGYLMHALLYDELFNVDAGSFSWDFGKPTLSLSVGRFATDDIPFTLDNGYYDWGTDGIPGTDDPDGTEGNGVKDPGEPVRADAVELRSEGDYLLLLGGSFPLNRRLDIGANFKYLHHDIGGYTSDGFGIDLGAIYKVSQRTNLGLSVKDAIGTRLVWSTDFKETKPPTGNIGASHDFPFGRHNLKLALDLQNKFENAAGLLDMGKLSTVPHIGTEATFFDLLMLRLGLEGNDFAAGAGIRILNFTIDYAFLADDFDNSHRIGLSFNMPDIDRGQPDLPKLPEQPVELAVVDEPEVTPEEPVEIPELPVELPDDKPPVSGDILAEVHFLVGDAVLSDEAKTEIDKVLLLLEKYPALILDIEGHTDNTPINTDEYPDNYALSKARAEVVMNYLIEKGVSRVRLSATGFGPDKMRFSGEERYRNRRVEIVVN